jgi:hypothetical protein
MKTQMVSAANSTVLARTTYRRRPEGLPIQRRTEQSTKNIQTLHFATLTNVRLMIHETQCPFARQATCRPYGSFAGERFKAERLESGFISNNPKRNKTIDQKHAKTSFRNLLKRARLQSCSTSHCDQLVDPLSIVEARQFAFISNNPKRNKTIY